MAVGEPLVSRMVPILPKQSHCIIQKLVSFHQFQLDFHLSRKFSSTSDLWTISSSENLGLKATRWRGEKRRMLVDREPSNLQRYSIKISEKSLENTTNWTKCQSHGLFDAFCVTHSQISRNSTQMKWFSLWTQTRLTGLTTGHRATERTQSSDSWQ